MEEELAGVCLEVSCYRAIATIAPTTSTTTPTPTATAAATTLTRTTAVTAAAASTFFTSWEAAQGQNYLKKKL